MDEYPTPGDGTGVGKENKATMMLQFTSGTNTAANASAYQVTGGEWTSGTIQWSNKPAANVLLQANISHNNLTGYTINCLAAVQHWYSGDPTGQNENYKRNHAPAGRSGRGCYREAFVTAMYSGAVPQQPPSRVAPILTHSAIMAANSFGAIG